MKSRETKELPTIEIVPATPEDIRGLREVQYVTQIATYPNEEHGVTQDDIRRNLEGMFDEEDIRARGERLKDITPNERVLVAKCDGKVVGFATANTAENINELHSLYVLPEFQGQGVGKRLWEQASAVFDPTKDTVLDVVSYNNDAIDFYKRLGFEETGESGVAENFILECGSKIPTMHLVKRAADPDEAEMVKMVAESANSPENEMVLAFERLRNPAVRGKYITHLEKAHQLFASSHKGYQVPSREEIERGLDERITAAEIVTQVDHGDEMPNRVDGLHLSWRPDDGHKLTSQEWSQVEAHEKGHAVRMDGLPYVPNLPHTPENIDHSYIDKLFHDAIDPNAVPFPFTDEEYQKLLDSGETRLSIEEQKKHLEKYSRSGGEIIERMSQLKNYFGMRGDEIFTKTHLDYARKHYAEDRFDNMSELLQMITPEKEERFLELINSVGV